MDYRKTIVICGARIREQVLACEHYERESHCHSGCKWLDGRSCMWEKDKKLHSERVK
jgi:hypothetical protein